MDEKGEKIGILHRVIVSLTHKIEIKDLDENTICEIHKKIVSVRKTYDIKDPEGNTLGRFKKAITAIIHPKLTLEGPDGKPILDCKGKPMRWDFTIVDPKGKIVATVGNLNKWKNVFVKGLFNFTQKYAMCISDEFMGKVDPRLLLGYVITIDNIFHDTDSGGRLGRAAAGGIAGGIVGGLLKRK